MPRFRDRTGEVYNFLRALSPNGRSNAGEIMWLCECILCGKETTVVGGNLTTGLTKSCGCIKAESSSKTGLANKRHGMEGSTEYVAWKNAISRVTNPHNVSYKHYGERGIDMCPEWMGERGFDNFIAVIGRKPDPSLSLDRIDNERGYWPDNVRWTDWSTQNFNRRGYGRKVKA